MAVCVRDMWEAVNCRVCRLNQPAEVLAHYQLTLCGKTSKLYTSDERIMKGEQLVAGDAKAVAAGYPTMVNPSDGTLFLKKCSPTQKYFWIFNFMKSNMITNIHNFVILFSIGMKFRLDDQILTFLI